MKIAVSSTGSDLEANVDPRFGRCSYFLIVDVEGDEIQIYDALENESANAMRGAGIQAAQTVANEGTDVAITGNLGPNAFNALSSAGVKIFAGASGTIRKAVEDYLDGKLQENSEPTNRKGVGKRGSGRGRRR